MLYVEHYRTVSFAYLILRTGLYLIFAVDNILCAILGKASTAKQTCLGSLLGLELNWYCVLISYFWRHPGQLDLPQHHRAPRSQSPLTSGDLVPRRQRDSFGQFWVCTWGVVALFHIMLYYYCRASLKLL